ncbi:MAG TPA: hypothetical protein VFF06_28500 [Polyangia bacterium]|nr:hypothetical protein [Polyangia bacterium]
MRTLLLAAALALTFTSGCGKGSITLISCGPSNVACDVSGSKVCCVGSTDATCTDNCTGMPRFNCRGPTTCEGGICCVDDLGGHCVQTCNAQQKPACETNADCSGGGTCGTKSYLSSSGTPLFTIGVCP